MDNKKMIIIEAVVALCAMIAIVGIFFLAQDFGYTAYANEPVGNDPEKKIELVIEAGQGIMDVAEKLEEKEMIASKHAFWLRYKFSEYNGLMKAGTYELNETMGTDDILAVITQSGTTE
ncbi:MAG: hypothetical protein E7253_08450 [Lachnospiraceae bacterium]|nr:hypothetical protein [Lachnospiraceae bacterium]